MEIDICIAMTREGTKYPQFVRTTLTDADLQEWAKLWVSNHYHGEYSKIEAEVEAIKP